MGFYRRTVTQNPAKTNGSSPKGCVTLLCPQKAVDGKFVFFIHISKCQSINYKSLKFQVDRLRNKKVTIYCSALSYKQEDVSLAVVHNMKLR